MDHTFFKSIISQDHKDGPILWDDKFVSTALRELERIIRVKHNTTETEVMKLATEVKEHQEHRMSATSIGGIDLRIRSGENYYREK